MTGFNAVLHDATTHPTVREIIGWFMANAEQADFAIANVRLAALDLRPAEQRGLRRCRFLLSRLDAEFSADAALLTRDSRRSALENLLRFIDSGRLEVRSTGAPRWSPDFSVYHRLGPAAESAMMIGAHYFQMLHTRPVPLTCVLREIAAVRRASENFERLWQDAYDVLPVIRETLEQVMVDGAAIPLAEPARNGAANSAGLAG
jgi:hypothetical protein